MSRCVILSACPVQPEFKRLLRSDDFIIACDAGYRNCERLGCKPDIIVGDFDSAPCPQQNADDIVVLPHVKDDTDTEYAAKLAAQKGFDEVLLLGALGGKRVEHTLANLCTGLGLEQRGIRAALQDERSRITFVLPGESRRYPKEEFFYFSAFPMEGRAAMMNMSPGLRPLLFLSSSSNPVVSPWICPLLAMNFSKLVTACLRMLARLCSSLALL